MAVSHHAKKMTRCKWPGLLLPGGSDFAECPTFSTFKDLASSGEVVRGGEDWGF